MIIAPSSFSKNLQIPILPGMEDFVKPPTLSNHKKPSNTRDLYNLRLLTGLRSADHYGLPKLQAYAPSLNSIPLAFHEARALWNKRKTLRGYFIHFYISDEKFDCLRRCPERYLPMLKSADFIIGLDFSTYRNYPYPVLLKNGYDNMLLSAYYQRKGVKVVSNIFWVSPMSYDIVFSGQPCESAICVGSKSLNLADTEGVKLWLHGYNEAINRLSPKMVIRFGKIVPNEDVIISNPVRYEIDNPYINRLRNGR